jgi:hypothetical protein
LRRQNGILIDLGVPCANVDRRSLGRRARKYARRSKTNPDRLGAVGVQSHYALTDALAWPHGAARGFDFSAADRRDEA